MRPRMARSSVMRSELAPFDSRICFTTDDSALASMASSPAG